MCHGSRRAELWTPLDRALELLEPSVPDRLALILGTVADPARTAPAVLAHLDAATASLDQETDLAQVVRIAMAATSSRPRYERAGPRRRQPTWPPGRPSASP
ncbi:hypothetical protein [Streptomyces sp. MNP-20]|uniref:hypothetical protein n=1 Tax=Streptomyces sp. MNP-20 TaxID=2721165 RepID=UPI001557452E|nr:hypothetical protein [Streptomyces sp. MNP-20]